MKPIKFLLPFFLIVLLQALVSCGGDSSADKSSENPASNTENSTAGTDATGPASMQEALKQAQKQVESMQGDNKNVTPINFRKLKELLPDRMLNMPRTKHSGESAGAVGMKFSSAEARYQEGDKRLNVKLIDFAGIGMATMGMAAWATMEIDREDDNGYERTSNWNNFRAYEKCRTDDKFCSLKLYNEKGILAELDGYGIPVADLKKAAEQLNIFSIPGMRE